MDFDLAITIRRPPPVVFAFLADIEDIRTLLEAGAVEPVG